jgi:hypothetical protein
MVHTVSIPWFPSRIHNRTRKQISLGERGLAQLGNGKGMYPFPIGGIAVLRESSGDSVIQEYSPGRSRLSAVIADDRTYRVLGEVTPE